MLLAFDVGNTNIVLGLYDGSAWMGPWRIRTQSDMTVDEFAVRISSVLTLNGHSLDSVKQLGLASVVPQVEATINLLAQRLNIDPIAVCASTAGIKTGYKTPQTLGADRIANAVAGYKMFRRALVVIDFGTATNFDYVNPEGIFEGGIIAPGLMLTGQALFKKTAQLPEIDMLKDAAEFVAKDTVSAMTVGLFEGYVCLIEGLIEKLKNEVGTNPLIIATGGLASKMAARCPAIDRVEPNLTLEGIRLVMQKITNK